MFCYSELHNTFLDNFYFTKFLNLKIATSESLLFIKIYSQKQVININI